MNVYTYLFIANLLLFLAVYLKWERRDDSLERSGPAIVAANLVALAMLTRYSPASGSGSPTLQILFFLAICAPFLILPISGPNVHLKGKGQKHSSRVKYIAIVSVLAMSIISFFIWRFEILRVIISFEFSRNFYFQYVLLFGLLLLIQILIPGSVSARSIAFSSALLTFAFMQAQMLFLNSPEISHRTVLVFKIWISIIALMSIYLPFARNIYEQDSGTDLRKNIDHDNLRTKVSNITMLLFYAIASSLTLVFFAGLLRFAVWSIVCILILHLSMQVFLYYKQGADSENNA